MYAEYRERCQTGRFILGEVFAYETGDFPTNGIVIFNLATQLDPGPCANLDAIEPSVTTMLALARERVVEEVALPRIGAGIGGLDWADVRQTFEACVAKVPEVSLVVYEL
jgi:O-acetyl-ADP-ribose deacetylase (regulator of RNase III)